MKGTQVLAPWSFMFSPKDFESCMTFANTYHLENLQDTNTIDRENKIQCIVEILDRSLKINLFSFNMYENEKRLFVHSAILAT